MRHRQDAGGGQYRLSPDVYRSLRRRSPIVMLIGMTAFGWLIGRAIHASETGWGRQTFTVDILVMMGIVLAWTGAMVALSRPPSQVLAGASGNVGDGPLVVWPLGEDMRIWNVISVPFCGMFGSFFLLPALLTASPDVTPDSNPPPEIIQVSLVAFLAVIILATIWMISRTILHGVELTDSRLIAHGFFRTRRFDRATIAHAAVGTINVFESAVFVMLRMDLDRTVRLTLNNGEQYALLASSGSGCDRGADLINEWLERPRAHSSPVKH